MAKRIYEKVNGEWKRIKKIHTKVDQDWKKIKKGWVKTNAQWKLFFAGGFPPGIILPYITTDVIPDGWEEYNLPYGRLLMGADNNYPSTTFAGSSTTTHTGLVPVAGSHLGQTHTWYAGFNGDGDCAYCIKYDGDASQGYTRGGHTHSGAVGTVSIEPKNTEFRLVKLLAESQDLPPNVAILSHQDISGDINTPVEISADPAYKDGCLAGGSVPGYNDGGDLNSSNVFSTSYAGNHHHGGVNRTLKTAGTTEFATFAGNHNHTGHVLADTTDYLSYYLSMWYSASADIEASPNMIGMWEGNIAPEGWAICNGLNGTPDLRNKFIRFADQSTRGSTNYDPVNNNKHSVELTTTLDASSTHTHANGNNSSNLGTLYVRHANNVGHVHASDVQRKNLVPQYYALTFIMRIAD